MNYSLPGDVWVVIVSASVHWHNYRHLGNAVNLYHTLRARNIPESNIIFFNALDAVSSVHNPHAGSIYSMNSSQRTSRSGLAYAFTTTPARMIDYHGNEVTVDNFLRLLMDRPSKHFAGRKRLRSHSQSHVLIYLSGHGGNGFFKFRDREELSDLDFSSALAKFSRMDRYGQLMILVDTCQAESLKPSVKIPNTIFIGSSRIGENSYAYANHEGLGVAFIDRFTYFLVAYLNNNPTNRLTAAALIRYLAPELIYSHPIFFSTEGVNPENLDLTGFFGTERVFRRNMIIKSSNISLGVLERKAEYGQQLDIHVLEESQIEETSKHWSSKQDYKFDLVSYIPSILVMLFICSFLRKR